MSGQRSLFSSASSRRNGHPPSSAHELPRWRSPSPMAASIIPPPIVQSTHTTPPKALTQTVIIEQSTDLRERQSELEADLQFLLDAQAEGLVKGLEGGLGDDQASTGSTTPTAQSVRSASARRSRPPRRKLGLRSARRGIYNAILALSKVKDDEIQDCNDEIRENDRTMDQLQDWERKRDGLLEATEAIGANEDTIRVRRLRQEAETLQEEINSVELQLADMKGRHRKLVRKAEAVENTVQATLASYKSSLQLLDEDVQRFLSSTPPEERNQHSSQGVKASLWQLPPKRRTLDMAKDQWEDDRDKLFRQREIAEYEKEALDEGASVWKEVVAQVTDFERRLRIDMPKLAAASSNRADDDSSRTLRELLSQMDQLAQFVESKFEISQSKNWKLLVVAIGAESDALKRGRELMESAVGSTAQKPEDLIDAPQIEEPSAGSGDEIQELEKSFQTARRRMSSSDSDDPDPELLFSTQDVDNE